MALEGEKGPRGGMGSWRGRMKGVGMALRACRWIMHYIALFWPRFFGDCIGAFVLSIKGAADVS